MGYKSRDTNVMRWFQHYQTAKGVVNAIRWIASQTKVHAPALDGYELTLDCSSGGGPWNYLSGFPSCAGPFAIGSFALNNGQIDGNPARPAVIYHWGPYSHDHANGDSKYYFPGQRWTRRVVAGQPQIVTTVKQYQWQYPYEYQVPFWRPFTVPGTEPVLVPFPWRAIPDRRPSGLPEDSERGNSVPTPGNPGQWGRPGPTFIWQIGQPPRTQNPPKPGDKPDPGTGKNPQPLPRKVRRREKEKKRFAKISGVPAKIINHVTETKDLIDALYDALPKDLRTKLWRADYKRKKGTDQFTSLRPDQKAWYIYKYWKHLDLTEALKNIGLNQIEDFLIGQASSRTRKRHREAGGLTGFFAGPTL